MKYCVLILMVALTAFGERKLSGKLTHGGWIRIPLTPIASDRTNILISITSTNSPQQPQVARLETHVTYDFDEFPLAKWTSRTNDVSFAAGDIVTINVPMEPQRGNKRRYLKGLLHANRNFDAVIEVK